MKTRNLPFLLAAVLPWLPGSAPAAGFLQLAQETNVFNRVSLRAGGLPAVADSTPGQFKAVIVFGSAAPRSQPSGTTGAETVPAPRFAGGLRLGFVRLGAPFHGRLSTLQFGQIITPPRVDETGKTELRVSPSAYWDVRPFFASDRLGYRWDDSRKKVVASRSGTYTITWQKRLPEATAPAAANAADYHFDGLNYYRLYASTAASVTKDAVIPAPTVKEDGTALPEGELNYWAARPDSLRTGERFHYSAPANAVFATQVGPVDITWRKRAPEATVPADKDDPGKWFEQSGNYYRLYSERYVVSGSPVKSPRRIYWTGQGFAGRPVSIPRARVNGVTIVYNSDFPESVPVSEGTAIDQGTGIGTEQSGNFASASAITATLWYSTAENALKALNRQGRVFLELLGSPVAATGEPEHLGFEIVDVVKEPVPESAAVELGDPFPVLEQPAGAANPPQLAPVVANSPAGDDYVFQHVPEGAAQPVLHARKETANNSDLVLWWLATGEQGILWPSRYVRYQLGWPRDVARYNHYVRPLVATEAAAASTAITLPTDNVPVIEYQDGLDRPRAKLTADFKFYTWLDATQPAHRTLLRFTSGEFVAFERVFSWLDQPLLSMERVPAASDLVPGRLAELRDGVGGYDLLDGARIPVVENDILYLGSVFDNSITIIDVTSPAQPVLLKQIKDGDADGYGGTFDLLGGVHYLHVSGTRLYAVSAIADHGLSIIDVADPGHPRLLSGIRDGTTDPDGKTFHLNGSVQVVAAANVVYVTARNSDTVTILDVSNPQVPKVLKEITDGLTADANGKTFARLNGATSMFLEGNRLYVGSADDDSVTIIDVTTPAAPVLLVEMVDGTLDAEGRVFNYLNRPEGLFVKDGILYVADLGDSALSLIDVSDPARPRVLSEMKDNVTVDRLGRTFNQLGAAHFVRVTGSLALVTAAGDKAVSIIDVGDPANPRLVTEVVSGQSQDPAGQTFNGLDGPIYLAVAGNTAYVGGQNSDALTIMDLGALFKEHWRAPGFAASVATNLAAYDGVTRTFDWPNELQAPRTEARVVSVGDRINAPAGESGAGGGDYQAGYLNQSKGTSFDVTAYRDPFVVGFAAANAGAIIPVNAVPGQDVLEVQWFRTNAPNTAQGFKPIYWPAVIGRYTNQWPGAPREIILASNAGSGPLGSLEATGRIYYQNDAALPGHNPNEEHALLLGGQAYALRDDLNVTAGAGYSSAPFVLLAYTAADGRPAMTAFKVLREKPEAGLTFNYAVTAGQVLQGPMPLPLLPEPVPPGQRASLNREVGAYDVAGSSSDAATTTTSITTAGTHLLMPFRAYALQHATTLAQRRWLFVNAVDYDARTATGVVSAQSPLKVTWQAGVSFTAAGANGGVTANQPVLLVSEARQQSWSVTVATVSATSFTVSGSLPAGATNANLLVAPDTGVTANQFAGWRVSREPRLDLTDNGLEEPYSRHTLQDRKGSVWVYRGPHRAEQAGGFEMQYYYRTLPGFFFPSSGLQPPVGTIVPYLRPRKANGGFQGSAAEADADSRQALPIAYRPVWPDDAPEMFTAETLTLPQRGLPAVRGRSSLEVFYQQSLAREDASAAETVTLHDPTREKVYELGAAGQSQALSALPKSARVDGYQGKTYFPLLPPHLNQRFCFDPNRGAHGALVLRGEFHDEIVGADYVLLNALSQSDVAALKNVVAATDADKGRWDAAVEGLTTRLERFVESTSNPGTFISDGNPKLVAPRDLAVVTDDDQAVDSYALTATGPVDGFVVLLAGNGRAFTDPADPVAVQIVKVVPELYRGELKVIASANPLNEQLTFQQVVDLAGKVANYTFQWRHAQPVDGQAPAFQATSDAPGDDWLELETARFPDGVRAVWGGQPDVRILADNYLTMRYGRTVGGVNQWSRWTEPQLAEGWIKRVLAAINPFNQRVTDLFSNQVNTEAGILAQAGRRWEGDVALNLETINNYGLIEIYETLLRRGRGLSIDAGINHGGANDALLLAAGYLNDLYLMVGNEAWADAANPTIGIGTKDSTYGDVATALFAFKGQVASLLEEELALLRGRNDALAPGVGTSPYYNRLVWNHTRGIDSGEVIYALNYNIKDDQGGSLDGVIDAADAARMFPQGHGDAYGHYLTAVKNYHELLISANFTWVPRSEAVTVLGRAVSVDYLDERKFAAAAAAVARAGRQTFELTWRKNYQPGSAAGWEHFGASSVNVKQSPASTNFWALDHWAARTGQGAYLNWVVGNALLPAVDPDPAHEGIQKVDRTTVPELTELSTTLDDLQTTLDNAEGRLNPLGLPEGGIAFDISPSGGATGGSTLAAGENTHFEQILQRSKRTLRNAVVAFDEAKDVTRLMRSEQDSLTDLQTRVDKEELAFQSGLIELYGTPYSDDIGPGKTYQTGYTGPDLIHYPYVDRPELTTPGLVAPASNKVFQIDLQNHAAEYQEGPKTSFDFIVKKLQLARRTFEIGPENREIEITPLNDQAYTTNQYLTYTLNADGFFTKPASWTGRRASPGGIQQAIREVILARNQLLAELEQNQTVKYRLDRLIEIMETAGALGEFQDARQTEIRSLQTTLDIARFANAMFDSYIENVLDVKEAAADAAKEAIPRNFIVGMAAGGDVTSVARSAVAVADIASSAAINTSRIVRDFLMGGLELSTTQTERWLDYTAIGPAAGAAEDLQTVFQLDMTLRELQTGVIAINRRLQQLNAASEAYRALVARGDRLQTEREVFRQRAASVIQGFRTRDAAFRIFRNEKLERYKTLFDLAARYAFLAAQAYDYETGLLHTDQGRRFVEQIIQSRALGVVKDGEPQFAGSNSGDPGLSSALAEMEADWLVLKGRLGFNNPQVYGTTLSLRSENFRILPGTNGLENWTDVLQRGRKDNLLDDPDVRRQCMQLTRGEGVQVPGIIVEFTTTIADGLNLFGQPLAGGDHRFSASQFATKIFSVGVALEGYQGMDNPSANAATVAASGGTSPGEPTIAFLDPLTLSANPDVYLIPVGVDSMRSPPLGDASVIRTWNVQDLAIPLPFNLGDSDFSTRKLYQSSDSLTEPLFEARKHAAFRPVSLAGVFAGDNGRLLPSVYTSSRLIGRSVWNSKWKLVIPGHTLLNDPAAGLDRFIRTVNDIKIHFETYSYSGN